jgi:hypothetical protein
MTTGVDRAGDGAGLCESDTRRSRVIFRVETKTLSLRDDSDPQSPTPARFEPVVSTRSAGGAR